MSDIKTDPRHLKLRITSGIESPSESIRRLRQEYQKYQEEQEEQDQHDMDFSRLSTCSDARLRVIREAQIQEKTIRERLKKDGTPFPPYKFLELIGKGSYGRVYKWYVTPCRKMVQTLLPHRATIRPAVFRRLLTSCSSCKSCP